MTEEKLEILLRETRFEDKEHKEALREKLERKGKEMNENLNRLQEIFADARLVKEMAAVERPEDAKKWFGDHGVELSLSEVRELGWALTRVNARSTELSPDELENVAGGKFVPEIASASYIAEAVRKAFSENIFIPGFIGSVRDEGEETMNLSDSIKWG